MNSNDEHPELEQLLLQWHDGTLDDAGIEQAREILRSSESARKHFVQMQMLDAALKLESGTPELVGADAVHDPFVLTTVVPDDYENAKLSWAFWLAALAATFVIGAMAMPWILQPKNNSITKKNIITNVFPATTKNTNNKTEVTSSGVALLTRLVDVIWEDEAASLENETSVKPGIIAIKSGIAQLEFFCGATIVLEGPAKFEIVSSTEATMHRGRLRAEVPPAARGFSIKTSNFDVIDLGTEFGLSVGEDSSDVQVFDGEIEIHRESGATKLLTTGNALRHENGKLVSSKLTPKQFVSINDLDNRNELQHRSRYERWKAHSDKLRQDERLITYYAFDEPASNQRTLAASIVPPNKELDGAIVGADHVSGRWTDKGGLEFKHPGDRVRVQIPGEFESLTFATWIRIDSLDRWYNSLFLTDSYDRGEPHWQILDTGQLFFSVRVSDKSDSPEEQRRKVHQPVLSEPFWDPTKSGQWFHLAAVYNNETDTVAHYVNGKCVTHKKLPERLHIDKLRIGKSSIGNWAEPTKPGERFVIRNLNGRVDEFAIFSAALSADEIYEMYRNGKQ